MAFGDFNQFAPSESAYTNPGEYESTRRNMALEKATYQSNMDQFYKEIGERAREFDLSLDFQKESLAETSRQFDEGTELEREKMGLTERMFGEELDFKRDDLDHRAEMGRGDLRLREDALGLERDQFDFTRDITSATFLEGTRQFNARLAFDYTMGNEHLSLEERRQEHDEMTDWLSIGGDALALFELLSD